MSTNYPVILKKGKVSIHVSYGHTFSNNLYAEDVAIQTGDVPEVSLSLDCNLSVRDKSGNQYVDARELADGGIKQSTLLQILDDKVIEGLNRLAKRIVTNPWRMRIDLTGSDNHPLLKKSLPSRQRRRERRQLNLTIGCAKNRTPDGSAAL